MLWKHGTAFVVRSFITYCSLLVQAQFVGPSWIPQLGPEDIHPWEAQVDACQGTGKE